MGMSLKRDVITNREYIVMDGGDPSNYNYEFLASYKDELRFINEEGKLVRMKGADFAPSANVLEFYLNLGHTYLKLECESCDNDGPHNFFYDFADTITKGTEIAPYYLDSLYGKHDPAPLKVYLSDAQADMVFATISNLTDLAAAGKYKYVSGIHDCVSLLTDVYKQSGFPGHFSDYHTDYELLKGLVEGKTAFNHRYYYPSYSEVIHPFRSEISAFIKSIYGDNYHTAWHQCMTTDDRDCRSLGIESGGISGASIDYQKASLDPIISNIVNDVMHIRKEVIPKIVETSLSVWSGYHDFSPSMQSHIDRMINAPITYYDLHYTYVLSHVLNEGDMFKDKPYAKSVIPLYEEKIKDVVNDPYYQSLDTLFENYYEQCPVGYGDVWSEFRLSYEDTHCVIR